MKYAGFWRRLVASTIDQFLLGLVAYFIGSAASVVALYLPPISQTKTDQFFNYAVFVSYALVGLVYFAWWEGKTGETIGKKLLNLKLVRIDQPNRDGIGVARAAVRLVVAFIFQIFAGVNYILMLIDKQRRTLHDNILNTAVVYDAKGGFPAFDPDKLPLAPVKMAVFVITMIVSFLAAVSQVLYFSGLI
jgi:uncharacterized RDD family membrane protein YckC